MTFNDERRYAFINLPHARTIAARIGRSLDGLDAFGRRGNGEAAGLASTLQALELALGPFDEDPPMKEALAAADAVAVRARALVDAILETPARSDRLGQLVRNLFECLGLGEEGATLSLQCGENPDSALR